MTIDNRFSRQLVLDQWGETGQRRMAGAAALIVGVGGLGNPAALYLATAGIGRLVLNDFDTVDGTNLPRQTLFREADVGRSKCAAAAAALARRNPRCRIDTVGHRLGREQLAAQVGGVDVVLDGSDNFATRFAVNEACVRAGVPLVSGAAIRYEAQLAVFRPDHPDQPCYRCLYAEEAETIGDCEGQGVLAPLVGMIGAAMALEAMRLIVGFGEPVAGTLLVHDAAAGAWRRIAINRDPSCPVCAAAREHQRQ